MPLQNLSLDDRALVQASGLFDAEWYLRNYPDVRASPYDPLDHFLTYGMLMQRDPGPDFSTRFHIHLHGKATLAGSNALVHYLRNPLSGGRAENVLLGAYELAVLGRSNFALELANRHLPEDLAPSLASLRMIAALQQGDRAGWLGELNAYLATYRQEALSGVGFGHDIFQQLRSDTMRAVSEGPLISVLMTVFNAAGTVDYAVNSILQQSWRNLELLVVDDASQDDSWIRLQALSKQDPRIRLMRTGRNVGPYVAKSMALGVALGTYVTGHDSDDFAHPQRLERHLAAHRAQASGFPLSLTWGIRLSPDGAPTHISSARSVLSQDGFVRRVPISCLFETDFLRHRLGAWDNVRFGGDTELLLRAEHLLGVKLRELPIISMLCRDEVGSLSNDPLHGTRMMGSQLSPTRQAYLSGIRNWLQLQPAKTLPALSFPHVPRLFPVPDAMLVPEEDVRVALENQHWN